MTKELVYLPFTDNLFFGFCFIRGQQAVESHKQLWQKEVMDLGFPKDSIEPLKNLLADSLEINKAARTKLLSLTQEFFGSYQSHVYGAKGEWPQIALHIRPRADLIDVTQENFTIQLSVHYQYVGEYDEGVSVEDAIAKVNGNQTTDIIALKHENPDFYIPNALGVIKEFIKEVFDTTPQSFIRIRAGQADERPGISVAHIVKVDKHYFMVSRLFTFDEATVVSTTTPSLNEV